MTAQRASREKSRTPGARPPAPRPSASGLAQKEPAAGRSYERPSASLRPDRNAILFVALILSLFLAVIGIVLLRGRAVAAGAVTISIAMLGFLAASAHFSAASFSRDQLLDLIHRWLPITVTLVGTLLGMFATYEATLPNAPEENGLTSWLWLVGLVCFVGGLVWLRWQSPSIHAGLRWIQSHGLEFSTILAILGLALLARLYALRYYPYPWTFDEAQFGILGRSVLNGSTTDLFSAGWSSIPTLAYYPFALGVAIFGNSILAVRVVSAVAGTLSVLSLYLLARELFDVKVALMSAAFSSTFPLHLQFSRLGLNNIFDLLLVTLVLWLVVRAFRRGKLASFAIAGVASGLTVYASVGGRLVLVLALLAALYICIQERRFARSRVPQLVVFILALLLVIAPLGTYFIQNPTMFNARVNQVGIIQTGWLSHEAATPGKTTASVLWSQFTRSTLVYVAQGSYGLLFSTRQPYLAFAASLFFLLGMALAFQKVLKLPYLLVLAWFWSVIFTGGVLTIDPPASTRQALTAPAVAIFLALGIAGILQVLSQLRIPWRWQAGLGAIALVFLMAQNAYLYFGAYRSAHVFDDPTAEVAMQAGRELQVLGPKYSMLMFGQPSVSARFPPFEFLAPTNNRLDLSNAQAATLDLSGALPAVIMGTPNNLEALQEVAARYPGGSWLTVPSQNRSDTLVIAYVLRAPTTP